MARQTSNFPIRGTIDNIIFYQTKYGHFARRKASVSKKRISTDPAYTSLRQQSEEFGRTAKCGKLIRTAFAGLLTNAHDSECSNRLTSLLSLIIKTDETNERGKRRIEQGDITMLKNFNFNPILEVPEFITASFGSAISHGEGVITFRIRSFIPQEIMNVPEGATHFKLGGGAAACDFTKLTHNSGQAATGNLPLNSKATGNIEFDVNIAPSSGWVILLALRIEFLKKDRTKVDPVGQAGLAIVAGFCPYSKVCGKHRETNPDFHIRIKAKRIKNP